MVPCRQNFIGLLEGGDISSMNPRVLIVDADRSVANLLKDALLDLAAEVDQARDGRTGLAMAVANDYDLIVLDLMLPLLGGVEMCRTVRLSKPNALFLAVTARCDLIAPMLGTRLGFDDYALKPLEPDEFRAKAGALLERRRLTTRPPGVPPGPSAEGMIIEHAGRRVLMDGKAVPGLSFNEHELVRFLAANAGRAFSPRELLAAIWGIHHSVPLRSLSIDLPRLRRRLVGPRSATSPLYRTPDDRYGLGLASTRHGA